MKHDNSIAATWVQVDRTVNHPREGKLDNGVTIKFVLTPDNVPSAARVYLDRASSCFVLEFRYFSDEATEDHVIDHGIKVLIGKLSGRLFQIRVPRRLVDESVVNGVEVNLSTALRDFISEAMVNMKDRSEFTSRIVRKGYYDVTKDVVTKQADTLFANVR